MPHFKCINFYRSRPKIKLFVAKKLQNIQALGSSPPNPQGPTAELPDPEHNPSLRCGFLVMRLILDVSCSYFRVYRVLQ